MYYSVKRREILQKCLKCKKVLVLKRIRFNLWEKFHLCERVRRPTKIRCCVKIYVTKEKSSCSILGNIGAQNSWVKQLWLFHCLSWGEKKAFFLQNSVLTKNRLHTIVCFPLSPRFYLCFWKFKGFLYSLHKTSHLRTTENPKYNERNVLLISFYVAWTWFF